MDVAVDGTGDHVAAARVDLDPPVQVAPDRGDPFAGNGDVGDGRVLRRDDEAAPDDEVVAQRAVL